VLKAKNYIDNLSEEAARLSVGRPIPHWRRRSNPGTRTASRGSIRRAGDLREAAPSWKNGALTPEFRQSFDMLIDAKAKVQEKLAIEAVSGGRKTFCNRNKTMERIGSFPGMDSNYLNLTRL
jgi:hypothetical protein